MNKSKILEFFNADELVKKPVHLIGCGAIGSHVAEALSKMGVSNIHLYDFDTVEEKNITNQNFNSHDVGVLKVEAVAAKMLANNPDIKLTLHPEGLQAPYMINEGYVFLMVDNIDLRRAIVEANRFNPNIECFCDFRMRLTDAQYYFANAKIPQQVTNLLATMNFSHEEAKEATPQSACGVELSVIYTVQNIISWGVCNFAKYLMGQEPKTLIFTNMDQCSIDAFPVEMEE